MEIHYTLGEDDYLAFNLYHVRNSKMVIKSLRLQQLTGPIIFVLVPVVFAGLRDESFPALMFTFLLVSVFWVWLYPKFFWKSIINRMRKALKEGGNNGAYGLHSMWITEEGIREVNRKGESRVVWSGIEHLKEDDANLYLYTSAVGGFIIPKSQVADVVTVKTFIASHLNKEIKTEGKIVLE